MADPLILDPTIDYPQIRELVEPGLKPAGLPDSTIEMDVYLGRAESWALKSVPDPEPLSDADTARLHRAVIYYTASLLVRWRPAVTRQQDNNTAEYRQAVDRQQQAGLLLAQAEAELATITVILPPATDTTIPSLFRTVPSGRGG